MPGWLRCAFEAAACGRKESGPSSMIEGMLLPNFDGSELGFLSLLVGELQEQILRSERSSAVSISLDGAKKQLSRLDAHAQEKLRRVFESLGQLRLLSSGSRPGFNALQMFSDETWLPCHGEDGAPSIELRLSENSFELLTGYIDGHLDVLRLLRDRPTLGPKNRQMSPLVVWTPVWLELSQPEQLVYLRMESLMQMKGAWLRLDGLVGAPIEVLMNGIRGLKRAGDSQEGPRSSALMDQLRLFGRLGRKLAAHGVIKKSPDHGYMALDAQLGSEGPMLLWQASAERLRSRAETDYLQLVSAKLLTRMENGPLEDLLAVFAHISGKGASFAPELKKAWCAIKHRPSTPVMIGPGLTVQSRLLFIEWLARAMPNSLLPVPKWASLLGAPSLKSALTEGDTVRQFDQFVEALGRFEPTEGEKSSVAGDFPLSIASSGLEQDLLATLNQFMKNQLFKRGKPDNFGDLVVAKASTPLPANRISVKSEPLLGAKNAANAEMPPSQKMHKLAHEELENIMRKSPNAYVALKEKYISSLDLETRSLVLNVQRRLDSRDFDRHLRSRLVRFMIENPSCWNSVNSSVPN